MERLILKWHKLLKVMADELIQLLQTIVTASKSEKHQVPFISKQIVAANTRYTTRWHSSDSSIPLKCILGDTPIFFSSAIFGGPSKYLQKAEKDDQVKH